MNPYYFDKLKKIRAKQAKEKAKTLKAEKEAYKKEKRLIRNEKSAFKLQLNQRSLRNKNELKFREYLLLNGISYIWQQPFYNEDRFVCVDFLLPDFNIIVEIDGYFHSKQKQKDLERTLYLKKVHGINKIIRIKNSELSDSNYINSVLSGI